MQDNEHVERCDAAIAADIRGGECRVIAWAAAGRIRRSVCDGGGRAQQGASRLMALVVLFAGFISMIGTSAFPESTVTTSTPDRTSNHSPRPTKPLRLRGLAPTLGIHHYSLPTPQPAHPALKSGASRRHMS